MTARTRFVQPPVGRRLETRDTDQTWAERTCRVAAWRWDDQLETEHSRTARKARLRHAATACLTCPALTLCQAWLDVNPNAVGVIAGQYVNLTGGTP